SDVLGRQDWYGTDAVKLEERDLCEPPFLVDAEKEKVDAKERFQEKAQFATDVKDAARVNLGVREDFTHAHPAIIVDVVEVELNGGEDTTRYARLCDPQIDRRAREDFAAKLQFWSLLAVCVKIQDVEAVEQIERIPVRGSDEFLNAEGVVAEPD